MPTSAAFNELVSAVSGDEYPLTLIEATHVDLVTPFRWVNDNDDIVSNGDTYFKSSFALKIPSQPKDGLGYATISIGNSGDKVLTDFIDETLGVGVNVTLSIILPSDPDTIEWSYTAPAYGFVLNKEGITCRIQQRNMNTISCFPILYGSKYSPSLL